MCGIAAVIEGAQVPNIPPWQFWQGSVQADQAGCSAYVSNSHIDGLVDTLRRRGPDATFIQDVQLPNRDISLTLVATTLSLRGPDPSDPSFCPAPDPQSSVTLLFNGELYSDEDGVQRNSDTTRMHALLEDALRTPGLALERLDCIQGPWAFLAWHPASSRLYFARDVLGRRSILFQRTSKQIVISSVAPSSATQVSEFPPCGLAYVDFSESAPRFGLYTRRAVDVLPLRAKTIVKDALISGSSRSMYKSFLPQHWLRANRDDSPIQDVSTSIAADGLLTVLEAAVKRRLITSRKPPRFALLFSGGLDSTVLAVLLHRAMLPGETMTLVNVAFGDDEKARSASADRLSAVEAHAELQELCIGRSIELVLVNVPADEADRALEEHVRALIRPCDRPMDLTIGTALWCAARGEYTAPILFSGLGADELLGGYKGRHRTVWNTFGPAGLCAEMDADLSRLWFRNLGRDDRLVADHARELRHPFLDEQVVQFVTGLPVRAVCDLSQPDGVGDKRVLRDVARKLGLCEATCSRAKRAMQFGSRSKQVIERKRRKQKG